MYVNMFPQIGLEIESNFFAINNRGNLNPNLWCLCDKNLDPIILDMMTNKFALLLK